MLWCYAMPFLVPFFFFFLSLSVLSRWNLNGWNLPFHLYFTELARSCLGVTDLFLLETWQQTSRLGECRDFRVLQTHRGVKGKREREEQRGRIVRKGYKGWVTPKMESVTAVVYPSPVPRYCSLCTSFPCAGVWNWCQLLDSAGGVGLQTVVPATGVSGILPGKQRACDGTQGTCECACAFQPRVCVCAFSSECLSLPAGEEKGTHSLCLYLSEFFV